MSDETNEKIGETSEPSAPTKPAAASDDKPAVAMSPQEAQARALADLKAAIEQHARENGYKNHVFDADKNTLYIDGKGGAYDIAFPLLRDTPWQISHSVRVSPRGN